MPQETNLNVAPYFDDFDPQSNYYKVLFKPAYPVQARELNNLQSILQNQVEDMGQHFFKEGAKVIPGQLTYLSNYYAIQIEPEYLGVPISLYLDQMIGTLITGQQSGVTARVSSYITNEESERGNYTLYVDYFDSSTTDAATRTFFDDEVLITTDNITFATTFIGSGEGFCKTLTVNSNAVGSAFALSNGVYFLRGHFVDVFDQIMILDQYNNNPTYRIGLNVTESIVSSDEDPTLTDNAQGFNNYTAPGADRFKISANLQKKASNDYDDQNFVQLAEVQNGILREVNSGIEYNILGDELARRTFDESGHYYVRDFLTTVHNSLNNDFGNRGIYKTGQVTLQGNTPSDDLGIYKISPGKAYVRGYEVELRGPSFLDFQKPRTTKLLESRDIQFGFGPSFQVNRTFGAPQLGFDTTEYVSLRDSRLGQDRAIAPGEEIGIARFYDSALESGSYDSVYPDTNKWDVALFDLQVYSKLKVNTSVTLTTPVFIEGKSSGATAYLRSNVSNGTDLTVYCVSGDFFIGEKIEFNGNTENARTTIDVDNYEISDVKSLHASVGAAGTFSADIIPSVSRVIGISSITAASGGISSISSPGTTWPGIVTTGNIIQFSIPTNEFPNLAKVTQVNTNSIQVTSVVTVPAFRIGDLPTTNVSVTDLSLVKTNLIQTTSGNFASKESLLSVMPNSNIESCVLDNSKLIIRKSFNVNITNNSTGSIVADANETFLPFDEERYTLTRSDGTFEVLTQDKFNFTDGLTQLIINGLGAADTGCVLTASMRKSKIKAKVKTRKESQSVIISKSKVAGSGSGGSTLDDGLSFGNFPYGTRVQDKVICLNVPDILQVYGIFESLDENDPECPSMVTGSLDGPNNTTNDLLVGEELIGTVSGAKAKYISKKTDTSINFIYENNSKFEAGEIVTFLTSGVSAICSNPKLNSPNIINNFNFSDGQRDSIYDFSRIIRTDSSPVPNRRLRVYYLSAEYEPSDTGDITLANSYDNFDYGREVSLYKSIRSTDMIDGRPRVSKYVGSSGSRSPFEFLGRNFSGGQHSSKNVLASDESLSLDYNYYLPRMDRIYLDKDGILTVKTGAPADNPALPDEVSGGMNIANIFLPPYLYDVKQSSVSFIRHKRYQMSDISKLEQRIKSLEYYTSLNNLESLTVNQFVPDANGLNRFKSGIFVDNFTDVIPQDTQVGIRNSIDKAEGVLRPPHFTTALSLEVGNTTIAGIGTTNAPNQDVRYADILGTNIKRSGQMLTLDYTEESWLRQPFATRVESVTPFLVKFWEGSIRFEPDVDVWIDVNQLELRDVLQEGSFQGIAEAIQADVTTAADGTRSGLTPVIWKAWETTGTSVNTSSSTDRNSRTANGFRQGTQSEFEQLAPEALQRSARNNNGGRVPDTFRVGTTREFFEVTTTNTTTVTTNQARSGEQKTITEQIDTESLGDRIVSREVVRFMRARNIEFTATKLKPFTQVYPFFDNVDVSTFCISKLIEIEMVSGTFLVEEAIAGVMPSSEDTENDNETTTAAIVARVAVPNHKYGPYNNPTDIFERNPYNREERIPETYTETSTILNIDTFSLSDDNRPEFSGYIAPNMILRGVNSNAEARVTNVRLIGDRLGTLIGSFRVPSSNDPANPIFETGRSRLRFSSSPIDSRIPGLITTSAEEIFYSQGDIDNTQEVTLSLRNARVETDDSFNETRSFSTSTSTSSSQGGSGNERLTGQYRDPLAQSFIVDDPTGVYLTSMDIYFQKVPQDESTPVTVQIREVELGTPSQKILAYSEVSKGPEEITTSDDASIPTKFTFESPVYLNGQREYAIIIISNSTEYAVWISRLGESDVSTLGREEGQILVSSQRLLGSLYKSQNASVWTPSQYEDLTFQLFRADFINSGSVQFFNPTQPVLDEAMRKNPLTFSSNTVRVSLATTVITNDLDPGNSIVQANSGATGKFVGYGGSATDTLILTSAGIGFTPFSGNHYTFTGVALTSISGNGIDGTADITIENGVAIGATIVNGGRGYVEGEVLQPISIGNLDLGDGMRLSIGDIFGQNELVIENVQGEFTTGATDELIYTNTAGVTTSLNYPGVVTPDEVTIVNDGLHFEVFHRNHGMHASGNVVTLSGLTTRLTPTKLTVEYPLTATTEISLASTITPTNFGMFEGIGIGVSNPGYVKIGSEIIKYTGIDGSSLIGITRGVDNSQIERHTTENLVYKYELNGVSLRRINKTHNLNNTTNGKPITLDTFDLKIDMSDEVYGINRSGTGLPELHFSENVGAGGVNGKASYNIPFEMIIPNFNTMEPTGTNIAPSARTTSGTSISGSDPSFLDKGFVEIALAEENYFESPRVILSKINEDTYMEELPGNKSFTMNLDLITSDSRVSPAVDLNQTSVVFVSNRINEPIEDYATDPRVNSTDSDPNRCFYVTKNVELENPASSLKIFLDAYIPLDADIRAFYSLNQSGPVEESVFVPFPGFGNFNSNGTIISQGLSNGAPDVNVPKVDVFQPFPSLSRYKEYKFSIDNLVAFKSFRIKIILTSTNQATVPRIRNFRSIALA